MYYDSQRAIELMEILDHLTTQDNKRIFEDYAWAKKYADLFFHINDTYYSAIETAIMFETSADYLKHALEK